MAWATGAWAGPQSGIKSFTEGLNAKCAMVATECVATRVDWMAGTTTRGRMMRRFRNQRGFKTGRRNPSSGRRSESPHKSVYVMTVWRTMTGINRTDNPSKAVRLRNQPKLCRKVIG